ncbi:MAG: hypothetical protein L0229_21960 [Blastocatellia bacterium]|nr:hypothetical protein [Blastocatellia bacterium]
MRNHRSRMSRPAGCCLAAAISLLIVMQDTTLARQQGRPPGSIDLKREQREREQREAMLRTTETKANLDKAEKRRIEAAILQVKEDFRAIQIVRNEMVRNLLAAKPLDYNLISEETAEINERAVRLKMYLMPPVPEDKEKIPRKQVEFTDEEMKGALVELCNLIAGFIDNPVLKNPDTVDVEQSTKAGSDLLSVIELSGSIRKSVERLNKR